VQILKDAVNLPESLKQDKKENKKLSLDSRHKQGGKYSQHSKKHSEVR